MKAHEAMNRVFSFCHPYNRDEFADILKTLVPNAYHDIIDVSKSSSYIPNMSELHGSLILIIFELTQVTEEQMRSNSRLRELVEARQVYMWAMRSESPTALSTIGARMNRDHATVLHSVRRVQSGVEAGDNIGDVAYKLSCRLAELGYNRTLDVYNSYIKIKRQKFN